MPVDSVPAAPVAEVRSLPVDEAASGGAAPVLTPLQPTTKPRIAAQPRILGDWLGVRTKLEDSGITPTVNYIGFVSANLNSGTSKQAQYAGHFGAALDFDLDRIAGLEGGSLRVAVTNRHGNNISETNSLGLLQHPNGVFGTNEIWRLAGLWYQHKIGKVELRLGRLALTDDFDSSTCQFQSLYFCGPVAGHISANHWYNFPIATWGGRVKVKDALGYTELGVYQRNDRVFPGNGGFYLGFKGGRGALIALERGFDVKLGGDSRRAGTYKVGVFADTSSSDNLVHDAQGNLAAISGLPLAREKSRKSFYAAVRQQVLPADSDGAGGLVAFANVFIDDHRTDRLVNIMTAGVTYSGLFPGRPKDEIGLAIGRTRVNNGLAELQAARNVLYGEALEPQRQEYGMEANYSIAVMPGLSIKPNLQWYLDPGGRASAHNILVAGTGVFANF